MNWKPSSTRVQADLEDQPYDRWVAPEGDCIAEFYRRENGFLVRFPEQADFELNAIRCGSEFEVQGWPAPECDETTTTNLFHNAIQPILGNHSGGLFLHGSAVRLTKADGKDFAIAFLGLSRAGKTTLAGSFAKCGHPFMTEDVIDLQFSDGQYWLQPKRSKLRLFADSANHLLGDRATVEDDDDKHDVEAADTLPFAAQAAPLEQIYLLGPLHDAALTIRQLSTREALSSLMPNAFILDVEDKPRLNAHFGRLADLAERVRCYTLDFTRQYDELPHVMDAIMANLDTTKPV